MPAQSKTGNVKKLCGCVKGKRWACAHPWYIDYKAPKWHATRPNGRYRKNLDDMIGRQPADLSEASDRWPWLPFSVNQPRTIGSPLRRPR